MFKHHECTQFYVKIFLSSFRTKSNEKGLHCSLKSKIIEPGSLGSNKYKFIPNVSTGAKIKQIDIDALFDPHGGQMATK